MNDTWSTSGSPMKTVTNPKWVKGLEVAYFQNDQVPMRGIIGKVWMQRGQVSRFVVKHRSGYEVGRFDAQGHRYRLSSGGFFADDKYRVVPWTKKHEALVALGVIRLDTRVLLDTLSRDLDQIDLKRVARLAELLKEWGQT